MVDETGLSSSGEDCVSETVTNHVGPGGSNAIQTPSGTGAGHGTQINNPFGTGVINGSHAIKNSFGSGMSNSSQTTNPFLSGWGNPSQPNNPFRSRWVTPSQARNPFSSGVGRVTPQTINNPFRRAAIEDGPLIPNGGLTNGHSHGIEWCAPHPSDFNPLYRAPDDEGEGRGAAPHVNTEALEASLDAILAEGNEDANDLSDGDEDAYLDEA